MGFRSTNSRLNRKGVGSGSTLWYHILSIKLLLNLEVPVELGTLYHIVTSIPQGTKFERSERELLARLRKGLWAHDATDGIVRIETRKGVGDFCVTSCPESSKEVWKKEPLLLMCRSRCRCHCQVRTVCAVIRCRRMLMNRAYGRRTTFSRLSILHLEDHKALLFTHWMQSAIR